MPYPTSCPVAKHDLLMSSDHHLRLVKKIEALWSLLEDFDKPGSRNAGLSSSARNPRQLHLTIYSYPDAPQHPGPISRSLTVIGFVKRSSAVAQNLLGQEGIPSSSTETMHRCTLGVKRYHPHMPDRDKTNSCKFASFISKLRLRALVAIVSKDTYGRFGMLQPMMEDKKGTTTTSGAKENFAAEYYVGTVESMKAILNKTTEASSQGVKRKQSDTDMENYDTIPIGIKAYKDVALHEDPHAAAAAEFYSKLDRTTLEARVESRLYHMRANNGWVKAVLIQELDPPTKSRQYLGRLKVLDLACGKGGDMGKWIHHRRRVGTYVGVDVALGSLKDAAKRAREHGHKKLPHCRLICADLGATVLGQADEKLWTWSLQDDDTTALHPLSSESSAPLFELVPGGNLAPDIKVDVISIQFAIHYMMSTRQRASRFFQTASDRLEMGGNLIATTMDARVIVEHLMNTGQDLLLGDQTKGDDEKGKETVVTLGGGACRIRISERVVKRIFQTSSVEELFGLEYKFTLLEGPNQHCQKSSESDHSTAAVDLAEWLTPLPVLQSIAQEFGLELEYCDNFHDFYERRKDRHRDCSLLPKMKALNRLGSISQEEWEISRLYCALKFRKVR